MVEVGFKSIRGMLLCKPHAGVLARMQRKSRGHVMSGALMVVNPLGDHVVVRPDTVDAAATKVRISLASIDELTNRLLFNIFIYFFGVFDVCICTKSVCFSHYDISVHFALFWAHIDISTCTFFY